MMNVQEIQELSGLLQRLREADTNLRVFDADEHQYKFPPPLHEDVLEEFERKHQIQLPSDYRLFLTHIGNGGPGPDYGVAPFQDASAWGGCNVSEPFPWTQGFSRTIPAEYEEHRDKFRIWGRYPGVVEVRKGGCSFNSFLVVNGSTYGTVWDESEWHLEPTGLTFIVWYRRWVERALRILANEPLVDKIEVGMSTTDVVKSVGGDWKERQTTGSLFFESPEIPAQLELDAKRLVININRWPWI